MAARQMGKHLRVFVNATDQWRGRNLYTAIVQKCHEHGIARVAVLRGVEGFGASAEIHAPSPWAFTQHAPVVVEILDRAEKMDEILPRVQEMVGDGIMLVNEVELFQWGKG